MNKIRHKAIITAIKGSKLRLKITGNQCSSCAISAFCALKSSEEIELNCKPLQKFNTNEKVVLLINSKAEKLGILLLYILPSLIIFVTLAAGQYMKLSDTACALLTLLFVAFYFLLLYLYNKKLKMDFEILREDK